VGTWHDPDLGRPIAAPLERCAELLGVDLATIGAAAVKVERYLRVDGAKVWSLTQLERQLGPRRTAAAAAAVTSTADGSRPMANNPGVVLMSYGAKCYSSFGQLTSNLSGQSP
jgi:hypothetical protein